MILVVGGAGQGKLAWALKMTGRTVDDVAGEPEAGRSILTGLAQWLRETEDPMPALEKWLEACPQAVILCDEVGCGVVPMDRADRAWRERVGRTCCTLAERADCVVRLYCGIPSILKGEPKWN